MDLSELQQITATKKIKVDAEKLKEKLTDGASSLVNIRVGQDTLFWEVKEKLSSTQRERECLQKNMVELLMQHESVSAQYQEERRRQPELLNKVESTRALCDVLEENVSRVRSSLQRSAANRAALAEAYTRAADKVASFQANSEKKLAALTNELRSAQERAMLREKTAAEAEKLREQRDALSEKVVTYNAVIQELRQRLPALTQINSILASLGKHVGEDLGWEQSFSSVNREKVIQDLREELRRVCSDFIEQMDRQRKHAGELEREAGAAVTLREVVAQAENRNEALSNEVKRLTSELSVANDAAQKCAQLKTQNQELQSNINDLKRSMSFLVSKSEEIAKELDAKTEKLQSQEHVLAETQKELRAACLRVTEANEEISRERQQFAEQITNIEKEHAMELERKQEELNKQIEAASEELNKLFEGERRIDKTKINDLENALKERDDNIEQFKQEIETLNKARNDADNIIADLNATIERERSAKEDDVNNYEHTLAEKDKMIEDMESKLSSEKANLAKANATIEELKLKLEKEQKELNECKIKFGEEIAQRDGTIEGLKRDLFEGTDKVSVLEKELDATKAELHTAKADVADALDNVRRLEAVVRRKDDDVAKQMNIIISNRSEKAELQEKLIALENRIKEIQNISSKPDLPASSNVVRRQMADYDDNAMAAPPAPTKRQATKGRDSTAMGDLRAKQSALQSSIDDAFFGLFSDSDSLDTDDNVDLSRRFEAMSRGQPIPLQEKGLKRRLQQPSVIPPDPSPAPQPDPPQTKRKFFKTRRCDRGANKNK